MNGKQSSTTIRQAEVPSIDAPGSASLPTSCRVLTVREVARQLRCSQVFVHSYREAAVLASAES
jgi:hypothetical protein